MVHEIHSCCVRKSHLPSTWQRAKLRNRLLLNSIVRILATIHPDVLLAPGVNPRGGASVVIDKVWTALWRVPLLPQGRKLSCSSSSSACCHHRSSVWSTAGRLLGQIGGVCTSSIFWQSSVLMSLALHLSVGVSLIALALAGSSSSWTVPACGPRVVVHIICPPQVILSPLPSCWQPSLCIFKGAECPLPSNRGPIRMSSNGRGSSAACSRCTARGRAAR